MSKIDLNIFLKYHNKKVPLNVSLYDICAWKTNVPNYISFLLEIFENLMIPDDLIFIFFDYIGNTYDIVNKFFINNEYLHCSITLNNSINLMFNLTQTSKIFKKEKFLKMIIDNSFEITLEYNLCRNLDYFVLDSKGNYIKRDVKDKNVPKDDLSNILLYNDLTFEDMMNCENDTSEFIIDLHYYSWIPFLYNFLVFNKNHDKFPEWSEIAEDKTFKSRIFFIWGTIKERNYSVPKIMLYFHNDCAKIKFVNLINLIKDLKNKFINELK